MGSYRYAHVSWTGQGVRLYSTDSEILDRILAELKKFIPEYSVRDKSALLSGETSYYWIANLRGKDFEVGGWIIKQLCLQGWEPFAIEDIPERGRRIHLRYKG